MIEIEILLLSHPLLFIFIYETLIKNGGTWNKKWVGMVFIQMLNNYIICPLFYSGTSIYAMKDRLDFLFIIS